MTGVWPRDILFDVHRGIWQFAIPLNVPSANTAGKNSKDFAQRKKYQKLRDEAGLWLKGAKNLLAIPDATEKRSILWTRILGPGQRVYDDSNFVSGLKPIEDQAVACGLLIDDKNKWYERLTDQTSEDRGMGPALRVMIRRMG